MNFSMRLTLLAGALLIATAAPLGIASADSPSAVAVSIAPVPPPPAVLDTPIAPPPEAAPAEAQAKKPTTAEPTLPKAATASAAPELSAPPPPASAGKASTNAASTPAKLDPLRTVDVPARPVKSIPTDATDTPPTAAARAPTTEAAAAAPQTEEAVRASAPTPVPAVLRAQKTPNVVPAVLPSGPHTAPAIGAAFVPLANPAPNVAPRSTPAAATPIAAAPGGLAPSGAAPTMRQLALSIDKSQVVHLARPARDVLVASPGIADVVLRSADTVFVLGRKVGSTNVYFFDAAGQQIDQLDVRVDFDSAAVEETLKRTVPGEQIEVSAANQSIVLTGTVGSAIVAENARQVARQFVGDDKSIINLLRIRGQNQVLLRVRVAEMSRQIVKELGISPNAIFNVGGTSFNLVGAAQTFTNSPFAALAATTPLGAASRLTNLLQALESNGLVKTLAEPNLTAVSGEPASFLVGGEFPVPAPQTSGGGTIITITFKEFGIRLTFTPVVLSPTVISLHIATEVSQLSTQGQVQITGFTIPALSVRRAETTIELPSGGSIAIAGLLQNDIQNTIQGLPGLKDIPVLGALFSSTQFQRNESDLVITCTPLLVKPVDPNALAFPTDGFGPASDFDMYLLGRIYATYSKPDAAFPHGRPKGPFGYILE